MKKNISKILTALILNILFLTQVVFIKAVSAETTPQEFNLKEQLEMSKKGESATKLEQTSPASPKSGVFENTENSKKMGESGIAPPPKTTTFFGYTLLQPLPTSGKDLDKNVTLSEYMAWLYRFALVLAGFLAVMMIVIGGVTYIASGANEGLKTKAKGYINGALQGLLLAIAAYLLLYTINPSLVTTTPDSVFKELPITGAGGSENVEKTGSNGNTGTNNGGSDNEGQSYNDGMDYIEGTKNPLTKPSLDISGIGEGVSKEDSNSYNDGINNIEGTENPLYKPQLEY